MNPKTFHSGKYFISFKRGFDETKKDINITVDKLFECDSLRFTLSDDENPTFLCRITVNRCDYEDLKKQQGLLIDFENFPSQVIRLLQQCSANNMFLIINEVTPVQYSFEIVEHNEFRRLVHLSLKTAPATDEEVKKHMTETISELKKSLGALKSTLSSNEILWNDKCTKLESKIYDLTHTLSKMEEEKIRQQKDFEEALKAEKERLKEEKLILQKTADLNANNLLSNVQDNVNKKDRQISELHSQIKQLRDNIIQLENHLSEKTHRSSVLEKEVQSTHVEVATLKAKNTNMERDIMDKEKQIHELNLKCSFLDKTLKDNSNMIKELNDSLTTLKLEKSNLERRLAISESLANKNNEAAHSTTEQLIKANQIISKQNSDLIEVKDKLLCRTAIALEQEKVIERNIKEIEELKTEIATTKEAITKLNGEFDSLKKKYDDNEKLLKDRDETIKNNNMVIQWLHKKVEESSLTGPSNHKSRPASNPVHYYLDKNKSTNVSDVSEESVNFYDSTKVSNVEDSPAPLETNKRGFDPKYLQPAADEKHVKKKDVLKSKTNIVQRQIGKENIVDLPKVDYRDKRISRGTTYRATPVSAYFP